MKDTQRDRRSQRKKLGNFFMGNMKRGHGYRDNKGELAVNSRKDTTKRLST